MVLTSFQIAVLGSWRWMDVLSMYNVKAECSAKEYGYAYCTQRFHSAQSSQLCIIMYVLHFSGFSNKNIDIAKEI